MRFSARSAVDLPQHQSVLVGLSGSNSLCVISYMSSGDCHVYIWQSQISILVGGGFVRHRLRADEVNLSRTKNQTELNTLYKKAMFNVKTLFA
jgi:hypothetical protein